MMSYIFKREKGNKEYLKAPANARAVYSPKLSPQVTSIKSIMSWPPSRARSTSMAAMLVT